MNLIEFCIPDKFERLERLRMKFHHKHDEATAAPGNLWIDASV